jgi:hypothetical protein
MVRAYLRTIEGEPLRAQVVVEVARELRDLQVDPEALLR